MTNEIQNESMFGKDHFLYTYTHDFHINVDIILTEMQNDLKVNNHYFHSSGVF